MPEQAPQTHVVIMAGGRGERFWPQSRLRRPKHLLPIVGEDPMLAQTLARVADLIGPEQTWIITNAEQRQAVLEVCPQLLPERVIGEPVGRDTAAAVGLATVLVQQQAPDAVLVMLPADATIHDTAGFQRTLKAAIAAATKDAVLVTIGIPPSFAATGYGYLKTGEQLPESEGLPVQRVSQFAEKPDEATAKQYHSSGQYLWNAGMFVFRTSTMLNCFERFQPGLLSALSAIPEKVAAGAALPDVLETCYPDLQKISVDYAIMEPASAEASIVCVPATFDWDDVGEWPAVARHTEQDTAGNAIRGQALCKDSQGNIVVTEAQHMVALLGVSGLIVVQTPDATLICPKDRAQDIKALVRELGARPGGQALM